MSPANRLIHRTPLKLLSFFSNRKLRSSWSYSPQGHLWRLLFGTGRVVGEVRDHERKQVSFFCLREDSGTPLWEHRTMKEPWWTGIEAVHRDSLILHGFEKPDLPEHRRIFVLDLETGRDRWMNDDLTFWFAYQDRVYAHRTLFEKRVGYVLSLDSGEILETHDNGIEELFGVRQLARREEQADGFLFPNVFEDSRGVSKAESRMLKQLKHKTVVGNVEVLQKEPFFLYSYHVGVTEQGLDQHLVVLDEQKGGELFSEVLARNVPAPVPDSFFVKDSVAYFVKDQNMLVALPLPTVAEDT